MTVNEVKIARKSVTKYVGVQLDETSTFHKHVEYLKSKTVGKLKLLGKIRPIMDQTTALSLYQSLIVLIYDYCDVVYNCISQRDSQTLQRLQNMGLKSVLKVGKLTSTEFVHSTLGVLPLDMRRDMHVTNEMAKIHLSVAPDSNINMFQTELLTGPCTRRQARGVYALPKFKLEMSKWNFRYRGPTILESLLIYVTTQPNVKRFKQANKSYWSGLYPNGIT